MVELTQVKTGQLLDLLQTIHQRVTVDEQLTGGLGHVQIVLEELIDGEQSLLIQRIQRILLEHFGQEDLAQGGGQLIDQTANAQIFVVDNALLGVKHLAHIDSGLGFLVSVCQTTHMVGNRADTDHGLNEQLALQLLLHGPGHSLQLLSLLATLQLLDHSDIGLVDAQGKVQLLVAEVVGDHIHGSHIGMTHLTNQEHSSGSIGSEMQFLCTDIDIAGQDVIHNNILNEGASVVLFLVESLCIVQGDESHGAASLCALVIAGAEHGVLEEISSGHHGTEGLLVEGDHMVACSSDPHSSICPTLTLQVGVGAANHITFGIDHAESTLSHILQLNHYTLKNTTGHRKMPP